MTDEANAPDGDVSTEVSSVSEDENALRTTFAAFPETTITAAIQASAPDLHPEVARHLYGGISQDSHTDVGGIMRSFATVDEDLTALIRWGPHRTAGATPHS
jgi:hypothetical protein